MTDTSNTASTAAPPATRIIAQDILGNPVLTSEIIKEVAIWLIAYVDNLRADACINRSDFVLIRDIPKLLITRSKLIAAGPRFRAPVLDANDTFAMVQAAKDVGNFLYQGVDVRFLPDVRYQRMLLDFLFDLADHALVEDGTSTGADQQLAATSSQAPSVYMMGDPTIPTAAPNTVNPKDLATSARTPAGGDRGYFDAAFKPLHPRASALQRPPLTPQLSNFGGAPSKAQTLSKPSFNSPGLGKSPVAPRPSFVSRYSKPTLLSVNNQAQDAELDAQVVALQQRIAALKGPDTTVTTTVTTAAPVPSGSGSLELPDISSPFSGDGTSLNDVISGNPSDGQGVSTINLSALVDASTDMLPGMPHVQGEAWTLAPETRNDAEGSSGRFDVGI